MVIVNFEGTEATGTFSSSKNTENKNNESDLSEQRTENIPKVRSAKFCKFNLKKNCRY